MLDNQTRIPISPNVPDFHFQSRKNQAQHEEQYENEKEKSYLTEIVLLGRVWIPPSEFVGTEVRTWVGIYYGSMRRDQAVRGRQEYRVQSTRGIEVIRLPDRTAQLLGKTLYAEGV